MFPGLKTSWIRLSMSPSIWGTDWGAGVDLVSGNTSLMRSLRLPLFCCAAGNAVTKVTLTKVNAETSPHMVCQGFLVSLPKTSNEKWFQKYLGDDIVE